MAQDLAFVLASQHRLMVSQLGARTHACSRDPIFFVVFWGLPADLFPSLFRSIRFLFSSSLISHQLHVWTGRSLYADLRTNKVDLGE